MFQFIGSKSLVKRTSGASICDLHILIIRNLPQIFKTAKELDLGCGAGGGKDSQDILKVGSCTGKWNILKAT